MPRVRKSILSTSPEPHGGPDGSSESLIDFSVNSNPFGPPRDLLERLRAIDIASYPDPGSKKARALAAEHHGVSSQQISFGNGTSELIHRIAAAYLRQRDRVLVFGPSFGEYARASKLYGARVRNLEVYSFEGFGSSPDDAADKRMQRSCEAIQHYRPSLVWLCHPNNPTGHSWSFAELQYLADICEHHDSLLIIDAAYLDMSTLSDKRLPSNCLSLHSLTKAFSIAGVRVGYAVATAAITKVLERMAAPWQSGSHAQIASQWALSDKGKAFLQETVPKLLSLREHFQQSLKQLGYRVTSTQTSYFLCEVMHASLFTQRAKAAGFRVRDCSSFGLSSYVRLATQLPNCNHRFIDWLCHE